MDVTRQAKSEAPKVSIFARIDPIIRDGIKAAQKASGRTWEREVEEALRYYLQHGQ